MLRLLRKKKTKTKNTKDKKMEQGKSSTYWLYLISEFVIVILGILIALQIDNWNNKRIDRNFEESLLNEFKANLSSDLQDIEFNIEYLRDIKTSNSIIARFLDHEFEYNDSLDSHFGRLANAAIFMADVSTYESSKSVGLTIIRNDELRRKISYLYSGRYRAIQQLEQSIYNSNSNGLIPAMLENLKDYKPLLSATPKDIDQIRESSELLGYIRLHIISIDYLIANYDSTREEIIKISELIDLELK